MVASQGIDEATVNQWIVKGHERLAQGGALPPAAADAVLRERFGERLPAVTADAQYWFDNSFRGETREKVAAWLDETGMARGVQLRYVAAARWLCKRCLKEWHRLIASWMNWRAEAKTPPAARERDRGLAHFPLTDQG